MSLEIEIRRDWLRAMPRLLAIVATLALLALFYGLGCVVSPRTADGRPVLLAPDVRAVEVYRRQAVEWRKAWRALDTDMQQILSASGELSLLAESGRAQDDFGTAINLARAVDGTDAPPALLGLHDQVALTAQAYVDASVALNRWLSAPTPDNRAVVN